MKIHDTWSKRYSRKKYKEVQYIRTPIIKQLLHLFEDPSVRLLYQNRLTYEALRMMENNQKNKYIFQDKRYWL